MADCSEAKRDAGGRERPCADRKRDHVAAMAAAPQDSRAVTLADKYHNLLSIRLDLADGRPVWDTFHADRGDVIRYHESMIEACGSGESRVDRLARACRELLAEVIAAGG